MSATNTLFGKLDEIAIERLKEFEEFALNKRDAGYYVAYSGGKDSDVILDLVRRSGVKYTAHFHVTTCDPPEVIRQVIKQKADVKFEKPLYTMWALIKKKGICPTRTRRYCCEYLKEGRGSKPDDAIIVTGVRWQESARRNRRRMLETCFRKKTQKFLNIIIEWSTADVWTYIRDRGLPYCSLYDEGFKRVGCVMCPLTSAEQTAIEQNRWPRIAKMWEKAIKGTYPKSPSRLPTKTSYGNGG